MSFKIYTKSYCGFCAKAKQLLTLNGYKFEEISLDNPNVASDFKKDNPTLKTVPQIWYNNEYIGGFDQLNSAITIDKRKF